jgi:hypothetical protein
MSYFVRSNTAKDELEVMPSRKKIELETTRSETSSEFSRDPSFLADEVRQIDELLDNISWMGGESDDDYGNSTDGEHDDDLNTEMEGLAGSEQILAQELESVEAMKSLFLTGHFQVSADPRESMVVVEERKDYETRDARLETSGRFKVKADPIASKAVVEERNDYETRDARLNTSGCFKVKADPMESMAEVEERNDYETRDARMETSGRDPRRKRDPVAESHDDRLPLGASASQNHLCCTGLENFLDDATWCPLGASDSGFHQSPLQKQSIHGHERTKILEGASGTGKQHTIERDMEDCSDLNTYAQRILAALRKFQSGRPGNHDKGKDAQTHKTHDTQTHPTSSLPLEIDFPTKILQTNHQPSERDVGQTRVFSSAELSSHQESLSEGLGMFTGTIASSRSPEKTATGSRDHVKMGPLYDSARMQVQPTADSESSDSSNSESIDSSNSESIEGAEETKVEVSPTPIIEALSTDSDDHIPRRTSSSILNSDSGLVLSTGSQKRESSTTKVQTSTKKKADYISNQNAFKNTVGTNQAYRSFTKSRSKFPGGTAGERAEASSPSSGKAAVAIARRVNIIVDTRVVRDVEDQGQETSWDGAIIEAESISLEEDVIKRPRRFKIAALLIGCLLLIVIGSVCAKFFSAPSPTEEAPITEAVENDVCGSATGPVPIDGRSIGGSTVSATYDEAPQCDSAMPDGVGVWYVALATGFPMVASTCGGASFETQISVFKGACGNLLCVVGNYDSCGLQSSVSWATENGKLYHILVEGPANNAGEFSFTVEEVVRNESCQAAIGPLPTGNFSISGSTQDSTVDIYDNSPPCGKVTETGSGIWYVVEGNGYFISANTCNEKDIVSPVQLILYEGACDDLTCIYGYDDLCGLQSSVSWNAAPGVKYYILVQGLNDKNASFELTIEESRRGDFCATAIRPVTTNSPSPLDIKGTTEGGLYFDSSLELCGAEPASQVVWYSIVGNGKTMAASTCTSFTDFTAVLTVYTGTCGALKCASTIVQDKCRSRHGNQYVSWETVEGQEYFILVYSDAAFKEGSFDLRLELDLELPLENNGNDDEQSGGLGPLVYIVGSGCALMVLLIGWQRRKFKASQRKYEY